MINVIKIIYFVKYQSNICVSCTWRLWQWPGGGRGPGRGGRPGGGGWWGVIGQGQSRPLIGCPPPDTPWSRWPGRGWHSRWAGPTCPGGRGQHTWAEWAPQDRWQPQGGTASWHCADHPHSDKAPGSIQKRTGVEYLRGRHRYWDCWAWKREWCHEQRTASSLYFQSSHWPQSANQRAPVRGRAHPAVSSSPVSRCPVRKLYFSDSQNLRQEICFLSKREVSSMTKLNNIFWKRPSPCYKLTLSRGCRIANQVGAIWRYFRLSNSRYSPATPWR